MADLLTAVDLEDLSRAVTACSYEPTVTAEAHATYDTLVDEVVHKLNIQGAADARVEDGVPVISLTLEPSWKAINRVVTELVAVIRFLVGESHLLLLLGLSWWWGWTENLGRARVRVGVGLLWSGRATRRATCIETGLAWAWRSGRLWWLRAIACGWKSDNDTLNKTLHTKALLLRSGYSTDARAIRTTECWTMSSPKYTTNEL